MKIQFFSHACFSIESENAILLNDPYLSGTAFNDGWDLIEDKIFFDRFDEKKLFIYYSHEHPDHFSVAFLKSIEDKFRKDITVIFQNTRDGRVNSFLEKEGFSVIKLNNKKKFEFSKDFYITIGQVPFYDSWALIELEDKKILNANDCILETPNRVQDIKTVTDTVDILFTQFSYANWVEGGVRDGRKRALLAQEKLNRIKIQSEILNPKFIVPFASMIRFCHVENSYMNDEINTPKKTVEFIEKHTNSKAFLMKPYEIWDGAKAKDNKPEINFWETSYEKALQRPLIEQKNFYDLNSLRLACEDTINRVRKKNNYLLIYWLEKFGFLPKQIIKVTDLNCIVSFSWEKGFSEINKEINDQCIEMSSESLYFLFKFDFGIDTLNVNARFKGTLSQKKSLIRTFSPLALNNTGRYISFLSLFSTFSEPAFIKQGMRTVGIVR